MIINLISGPRNISTALMYSFAQRKDAKVLDEPFYAFYLHHHPEINHPGRTEILSNMQQDLDEIFSMINDLSKAHELVFLKNMAHHHIGMEWDYLIPHKNVFLVRNPKQLIASFAQVIDTPSLQDIGLKVEFELFQYASEHCDFTPIVIDSASILKNPYIGLALLCESLNIPFSENMLSWERGAIPEDGVWAKYWYKNVHESTGFVKQSTSSRPLPKSCKSLYQEALPYYESLVKHTINT